MLKKVKLNKEVREVGTIWDSLRLWFPENFGL